MTDFPSYKGWSIRTNFIGEFEATEPDFDPDNPKALCAFAPTLEAIHFEIDALIASALSPAEPTGGEQQAPSPAK